MSGDNVRKYLMGVVDIFVGLGIITVVLCVIWWLIG